MDPRPLDSDLTGTVFVEWTAPEHEHYEKNADWYWWSALVAVALFATAIWQDSFLFAVIIVIGWIAIVIHAARVPRDIRHAVTERGLVVDNRLYFWKDLGSFWIFYEPPLRKEIILESKKAIMPRMRIQIGESNPTEVREQMMRFLREREQDDSLIEMLARLARF
jgi:hypothetical protein